MNSKSIWLKTLVLALLGAGAIRSQERLAPFGQPAPGPNGLTTTLGPSSPTSAQQLPYAQSTGMGAGQESAGSATANNGLPCPDDEAPTNPEPGSWFSSWITYARECCCYPTDGNEIGNELFLRNGLSVPIGAKNLSEVLNPGWDIDGGFHVLFFNNTNTAAWTVDLSLSNEFNTASSDRTFLLTNVLAGISGTFEIPAVNVIIKSIDRTSFNYGGGREWYLWGAAGDYCHPNLRCGVDIGGRWGTEKMNFENFPHRTETFTGVYTDIHCDLMYPWRCYLGFVGLRVEWDYDFVHHILQQSDSDVTEINFMLDCGFRF